ncbi:MAG TPA: hypothetical protein VMJ10_18025 [Kofleriaceae bacterium]|nr:hypothetical protein [Kofleriaceae bacterium]
MKRTFVVAGLVLAACPAPPLAPKFSDAWPDKCRDYDRVTAAWTRSGVLRGQYQEVLDVSATFKSPEWRCSHTMRQAETRNLTDQERADLLAKAQAEMSGPYEVQLMVTTWDRRENDLDRGKNSVWHVVLEDSAGNQIEPLEIVKDKRPPFTVRAEFPALGDFAVPYVARFPHTSPLLDSRAVKLRVSGERGGVEVAWTAAP